MIKTHFHALGIAACAFLLTLPVTAAEKQPAKTPAKATASVKAARSAWPAETLSATIMNVDPAQRLLIVKGPDGTPFDMVVTASTRIESGSHRLKLDDLQTDANKTVSVRFVPERAGDVARSIHLAG